ncbi:MAG: 2-C-methyl-D-erythritol 2,4-cyclodiphosphate synthase [Candidatus Tectomicrobia bacterium]|uniref:2-C-methyl-D-erythritol 2,4-cyclodiphosphate synthase n=1 Tax=Tectimicrobiota bacterium TaxID=2528274 RepID=A0A932CM63_UNCTE|nr:2-C-methyl-D-erythritol 2,4-cyclodiphosphate synthase [Candidatus Tectomicrobia bacterium]
MRIGFGYDVHPLVAGRRLVLGGVEIPHDRGLDGHSDADVLIHAVCDALLGAMAEGDIGRHFPDSSPRYKDISSRVLLDEVMALASRKGVEVVNLDATVVAQAPRLQSYLPRMGELLAQALGVEAGAANVKAKSTEGLGFPGRGEGIAAYAVVLIQMKDEKGIG